MSIKNFLGLEIAEYRVMQLYEVILLSCIEEVKG